MLLTTLISLAMVQAVPGPATSPLVDEGYRHAWVTEEVDPNVQVFLDESWSDTIKVDGAAYPAVLMRMVVGMGDEKMAEDGMIMDVELVVDCKTRLTGFSRIWMQMGGELTMPVQTADEVDIVEELPADDPMSDRVIAFACGTGASAA